MSEWNNTLTRSINNVLYELEDLYYIKQYQPEYVEDLQQYNDKLISFKRMYCDTYRFLNKYVPLRNMEYILTLYPRHVYWSLTIIHLNDIIMFVQNGSEIQLIRYLMELKISSQKVEDKYIQLLGQAKLDYINLKNDKSCIDEDDVKII